MSKNNPFMNEGHLDVSASLNKINMVEIPGVEHSRRFAGLSAHSVLSSAAIAGMIRVEFGVSADEYVGREFELLHRYLQEQGDRQSLAQAVCEKVARNLGCLLMILTRQNINRSAARLDWSEEQWMWWKSVERVVIGGGILAGEVGRTVSAYLQKLYADNGLLQVAVELSDCAEYMPLAGVANMLRRKKVAGCLLDFGHTSCKRAAMNLAGEQRFFEKKIMGATVAYHEGTYNQQLAAGLDERITEIFAATIAESVAFVDDSQPLNMVVSIANYYDGRRFATRGGYAKLNLVSDKYRQYLQKKLLAQTGKTVEIEFVHDCTAAARSVEDGLDRRTAVVVLGTGLGAGFCDAQVV